MSCRFANVLLLFALSASLTQGSHYSRDESSETDKTEYNLASTLTGNISSNRHRAHAQLSSYPQTVQPSIPQPAAGYRSPDIDEPAGHETGGNGVGHFAGQVSPASYPRQPVAYPQYRPELPSAIQPQPPAGSSYPQAPAGSSFPQPVPSIYPNLGLQFPGAIPDRGQPAGYPGYGYPGQYLPQYPAYPQPQAQPLPVPVYPGFIPGVPGNVPVVTHPLAPPTSYQNQRHFAAGAPRDHFDHSFSMNTEYKEEGVHKGPFDVLNNHQRQGYGSGYGGGYNGIYNRPGY